MFEDIIRELKSIEKEIPLSVPIETDEDGYIEKECPFESCKFQFKVFEEDWANLFSDEKVFCPFCHHEDQSDRWFTTEQVENMNEQAFDLIEGMVGEAMHKGAHAFNQKPQKGFIRFSLEVSGFRGIRDVVPIPAGEVFHLKIQCEKCSARFAVIGSAFFCPCCGYNSALRTFDDSLRKIEVKLRSAKMIREQLASEVKRDDGEVLARSMIETALSDCVVAIQRLSEQLYTSMPGVPSLPQNLFQRVDDASSLWKKVLGVGYEDWLTPEELAEVRLLFQRRHLLAHCEGVVDKKYIERSGETIYVIGQRIVVREDDVRCLQQLVKIIADNVRTEMVKRGYIT